jgi:hypothetical protein
MEDDNVDKMCVREWWETSETTPRKLRTLEIVLKDVENTQNWWSFFVFPIVFMVHWHILDVFLMLQLFSFLKKIILSTIVDNTRRWDSCWEVCHHAVRNYNFLTQKKRFFLKINSSPPPPFAPCRESNNTHMDMCNIHMIILILRKTLFFGHDNWPWQLARDARPTVIEIDKP